MCWKMNPTKISLVLFNNSFRNVQLQKTTVQYFSSDLRSDYCTFCVVNFHLSCLGFVRFSKISKKSASKISCNY